MSTYDRRSFLRIAGGTVIGAIGVSSLSGSAVATSHFGTWEPVYTTTGLSVREGPGLNYNRIAVADQYTGGHVTDGPVDNDGYTWWEVKYEEDSDNGVVRGWSAEGDNWLTGPADFEIPTEGVISQPWSSDHPALDIAANTGSRIGAGAAGEVVTADTYDNSACGKYVQISHGNGWESIYCHMSEVHVSDGESVYQGEKIGEVGDTGRSTGPHVHYSIEQYEDPKYIPGFDGQDKVIGAGVPKEYFK